MWLKELSAWLGGLIAPYDPILKIISYIVGPTLAVVTHLWNRKARRELTEKAKELGLAEAASNQARDLAEVRHKEVLAAQHALPIASAEVEKLRNDLESITAGSQELWKLRDGAGKAFPEYLPWLHSSDGAKLITFGNLKGGVGKTTLAANFAAYISEKRGKPVLLIDLDYQGSLSNMLMLAIQKEEVESRVDTLFEETANLATMERARVHLVPKLNRGWLVPANYTFAQVENQLLLKWLLQQDGGLDVRYRLANALLRPEVRRGYAAIILDMPPRMTLGSINALVASHAFVVPTVLDSLSVEAVSQFLTNMKAIKKDLALHLDLAGIVGMMTREEVPSDRERRGLELARDSGFIWKEDTNYVFKSTLPRKVDIANAAGEDIAYFENDAKGPLARLFDPLFEEICTAVWKGDGP